MAGTEKKPERSNKTSNFGYANLDAKQVELICSLIKDKRVLDLGAGGLEISRLCAKTAFSVCAVDCKKPSDLALPKNVSFVQAYFDRIKIDADVAIVSWPINNHPASIGLIGALTNIKTVIYIGVNDGRVTMCGTPLLWEYLTTRELDGHLSGVNNVLVYSDRPRSSKLLGEEQNGISAHA